jgi:hypothetical protein
MARLRCASSPWIRSRYEGARAEIEDLLKAELQGDWNRVQDPEERVQLRLGSFEGQGLRRTCYEHPDCEPDPDGAGFGTQLLAAVYRFKGENCLLDLQLQAWS